MGWFLWGIVFGWTMCGLLYAVQDDWGDSMEPKPGDTAVCSQCGAAIIFLGPYWDHMGKNKPRHIATPTPIQRMPKELAFNAFLAELVAAGVQNQTPIIEALYQYREALLKWQRELIDDKARDAELAIAALRSYTREDG